MDCRQLSIHFISKKDRKRKQFEYVIPAEKLTWKYNLASHSIIYRYSSSECNINAFNQCFLILSFIVFCLGGAGFNLFDQEDYLWKLNWKQWKDAYWGWEQISFNAWIAWQAFHSQIMRH